MYLLPPHIGNQVQEEKNGGRGGGGGVGAAAPRDGENEVRLDDDNESRSARGCDWIT